MFDQTTLPESAGAPSQPANLILPTLGSVKAELSYVRNTGENVVNHITGERDIRTVTIQNARPLVDEFSIDREGFVLDRHATKVKDFWDEDELRNVYYPEMKALVKAHSGAARFSVSTMTIQSARDRSGCAISCRPTRPKRCSRIRLRSSNRGARSISQWSAIRSPSVPLPGSTRRISSRSNGARPNGWARSTASPITRATNGTISRACSGTKRRLQGL